VLGQHAADRLDPEPGLVAGDEPHECACGRPSSGSTPESWSPVHVSPDTITIQIGADDIRTVRRTTDQPVRNLKAQRSRKTANVS
jgi:hypothetical protein